MINYYLPTFITIDDKEYKINKDGDYRVILDIISALNDDDLSEQEKAMCALNIFYNFDIPDNSQIAIDKMMLFINLNEEDENTKTEKPVMDWEQDFNVLVSPINKALGVEIRSTPYLHWWTFIGGYMEIGECQFSTIANIRQKKNKGKKLDKWEQEFYENNRKKVDLKIKYSNDEKEFIKNIFGE